MPLVPLGIAHGTKAKLSHEDTKNTKQFFLVPWCLCGKPIPWRHKEHKAVFSTPGTAVELIPPTEHWPKNTQRFLGLSLWEPIPLISEHSSLVPLVPLVEPYPTASIKNTKAVFLGAPMPLWNLSHGDTKNTKQFLGASGALVREPYLTETQRTRSTPKNYLGT